jgi:hypothetical protein
MATRLVTVKLSPDARAMLRILAAHAGKMMSDYAEDLFWAQMRKRKLSLNGKVKERK